MATKKRKKNGSASDKRMTRHHIIPGSRGGGNGDNLMELPERFHMDWHDVFGNMTPGESIEFIEIVFLGKNKKRRKLVWTVYDLYELQLKLQQESNRKAKKKNQK